MRALSIALAVAAGVVALAFALQFFGDSERRIVAQTGAQPSAFVADIPAKGGRLCQTGEPFTNQAREMQLTIGSYGKPGPVVTAELVQGDDVVARGRLAPGWQEGVVRFPLRVVDRKATGSAVLCFQSREKLTFAGVPTGEPAASVNGAEQRGRLAVVYRGAPTSLSDLAGGMARRYGFATAGWLGPWTWWVMLGLLVGAFAAAAFTFRATTRPDERTVPGVARGAAVTALLIGAVWALLTPPFHVPDEISHLGYAQYVAETGKLPKADTGPEYSTEERRLLDASRFYGVIGRPDFRPPNTADAEAVVRAVEADGDRRDNGRNATTASANPPLYYLLEAPVYRLAPGSLLDKLLPMRLLSVLFGALTVLFATLFVRELLPRSPWTWAAGGLAIAFQPMFGFIVSGVNADSLMFACGAATFYLCARLLRQGLTLRRGLWLGTAVAAGVLTKPLFLAMVPPAALALLIALVRRGEPVRRRALVAAGAAAAFAVPLVLYQLIGSSAFDHPYFPEAAEASPDAAPAPADAAPRSKQISFILQLFLPRLPFLQDQLAGEPLHGIWLNGFLGRFGWLDYSLPAFVYDWGKWIALALAVLALVSLVVNRRALRGRVLELGVYVVAVAAVCVAIGTQDFIAHQNNTATFEQARYLFPLLALYAGLIGVVARLGGRLLAVALVALAGVHTVTALLATAERYYS